MSHNQNESQNFLHNLNLNTYQLESILKHTLDYYRFYMYSTHVLCPACTHITLLEVERFDYRQI